jgi:integrase/recombinase XerD
MGYPEGMSDLNAVILSGRRSAEPVLPQSASGSVLLASEVPSAEPWPVIVDRWIDSFESPRTRSGYTREARLYTMWCIERGLDPTQARRHDLEAYRNDRTAVDGSARTVARRLSAISSLYVYGGGYGLGANPVTGVKRPRVDKSSSPSQSLARREVPQLLEVAEADGARSAALVALLVLSALRVSEALATRISDLGSDKGHCVLTIRAKGGAETKIPLPPAVAAAVDAAIGARTSGPILATSTGKPMDRRHAHRTIQRLCKAAGIADWQKIGPHDLRHTAVTGELDRTGNIDSAQRLARHKSPVTTQGYDHRNRRLDDHPSYGLAGWFSAAR